MNVSVKKLDGACEIKNAKKFSKKQMCVETPSVHRTFIAPAAYSTEFALFVLSF